MQTLIFSFTENVKTFNKMFAFCWQLSQLDLSYNIEMGDLALEALSKSISKVERMRVKFCGVTHAGVRKLSEEISKLTASVCLICCYIYTSHSRGGGGITPAVSFTAFWYKVTLYWRNIFNRDNKCYLRSYSRLVTYFVLRSCFFLLPRFSLQRITSIRIWKCFDLNW